MYLFHRGQHMALSYSNAELFFVLLFPLVDRLASFYRLILDTLVCWCCVCVYTLPQAGFFRLQDVCDIPEMFGSTIFCCEYCYGRLPNSFISISELMIFHLQRRNSSPPKNWIENDIIYWNPAKRYILIQDIRRPHAKPSSYEKIRKIRRLL